MTDTGEPVHDNKLFTIGNSGQVIAIAIAIIYFCGFVVVTAYLGSLGIKEYEAFRTQYIISGTTLLLTLGVFYYFAGRHILTFNEDIKKCHEMFTGFGVEEKFSVSFAPLFNLFEVLFLIVVATIVITPILFSVDLNRTYYFVLPMMLGYIQIESGLTNKVSRSGKPLEKSFFLLIGLFHLVTFIGFILLAEGLVFQLISFFLGAALLLAIFKDRVKYFADKKIYLIYMVVFSLVFLSGTFGRYFYGQSRSSIGGGKPEYVRVIIDESNTPKVLQKELHVSDGISEELTLIAQTDSQIYLGNTSGENSQNYKMLIEIDRKLVKAVISTNVSVIKNSK